MLSPFEISNHPAGRIVSRSPGHTAAGMGTGTAEVKVFNGGSILGRFGVWTQVEYLVQVVAPVEYIGFSQTVNRFQVQRTDQLAADDKILQTWHGLIFI